MRKQKMSSNSIRTGLAMILVLLLIFGGTASILAAPKHDNTNERAIEAVENGGQGKGQGIENSKNPNSALHGNGNQEESEAVVADEDDESDKNNEEGKEVNVDNNDDNNDEGDNKTGNDNGQEKNVNLDEPEEKENVENGEDKQEDEQESQEPGNNEEADQTNNNNNDNSNDSPSNNNASVNIDEEDSITEGIEIIPATIIPEGAVNSNSITITDKEVPLSAPDLDRVIILDEEAPQSAPSLPQTGDANPLIMVITGLGMAVSGLSIRRRQRFTTSSVTTLFQDK